MMDKALSAAIGLGLAEVRRITRLSQEQLAVVARSRGLAWTRATVAAVETGRRQLSAVELLLLPQVLYISTLIYVETGDLLELGGSLEVAVTERVTLHASQVRTGTGPVDLEPLCLAAWAAWSGLSPEEYSIVAVELYGTSEPGWRPRGQGRLPGGRHGVVEEVWGRLNLGTDSEAPDTDSEVLGMTGRAAHLGLQLALAASCIRSVQAELETASLRRAAL